MNASSDRPTLSQLLSSPRLGAILFLGFASGLPLALTSGTLQAWLATADVDIETIGIFSVIGLPYTVKFFWAPFMDRFVPPFLGRRRGWMLVTQFLLVVGIAAMGTLKPESNIALLGLVAFAVAFISASQDIVFDAYRTDVLPASERGPGAAISVYGYRIAMLTSGALALILSDRIGWVATYYAMAFFMALTMLATMLAPNPDQPAKPPATLAEAVVEPLLEFMRRPEGWALLALIVLYKLGDAFAGTLTTAFLIKGLDFSATDVGIMNKALGIFATLVGILVGGFALTYLKLLRSLLYFGIFQALTNLFFVLLAYVGKNYWLMGTAIFLENLAGGMGTAAFVAFLMAVCNHRFTAFQFALLSAIAVIGRVFAGPPAGQLVAATSWIEFFLVTFFIALPGLVILWQMRERISAYDER